MPHTKVPPPVLQPDKCRGCIWGDWRETKQTCLWQECIKEGDHAKDAKQLANA